jgi:hypothetical protein
MTLLFVDRKLCTCFQMPSAAAGRRNSQNAALPQT